MRLRTRVSLTSPGEESMVAVVRFGRLLGVPAAAADADMRDRRG